MILQWTLICLTSELVAVVSMDLSKALDAMLAPAHGNLNI